MATPRIKSAQDFKIEAIEALKGQLDWLCTGRWKTGRTGQP
ncbi:hypothetical protein [Eubacterium aggregans]